MFLEAAPASYCGAHTLKVLKSQNNATIIKEEWEKIQQDLLDHCISQCLAGTGKDKYEHNGFFYDKEANMGQIMCSTHRSAVWWKAAVRHITEGRVVAVSCQTQSVSFSLSAKSRHVTDLTIIRSILAANLGSLSQFGVAVDSLTRKMDPQSDKLCITATIPRDQANDLRKKCMDGQLHWPGGLARLEFCTGGSGKCAISEEDPEGMESEKSEIKEEDEDRSVTMAPSQFSFLKAVLAASTGSIETCKSSARSIVMEEKKRKASNDNDWEKPKRIKVGEIKEAISAVSVSNQLPMNSQIEMFHKAKAFLLEMIKLEEEDSSKLFETHSEAPLDIKDALEIMVNATERTKLPRDPQKLERAFLRVITTFGDMRARIEAGGDEEDKELTEILGDLVETLRDGVSKMTSLNVGSSHLPDELKELGFTGVFFYDTFCNVGACVNSDVPDALAIFKGTQSSLLGGASAPQKTAKYLVKKIVRHKPVDGMSRHDIPPLTAEVRKMLESEGSEEFVVLKAGTRNKQPESGTSSSGQSKAKKSRGGDSTEEGTLTKIATSSKEFQRPKE